MNYFAGIDIGSLYAKAAIVNGDNQLKAYSIRHSGAIYKGAAEAALGEALENAGIARDDIVNIISTGYGRARVHFAHSQVTEITCHGKGANHVFPEPMTVIDIGGQDSKVIEVDGKGRAVKFVMNDKCAAGTGRFLEVMAGTLEVSLEEMSRLAAQSTRDVEVSSMCTVFAESEVISLFAEGMGKPEIAAGVFRSVARRITGLAGQAGKKNRIAMSGGVAKSQGMVKALEKSLDRTLLIPEEPQIIGALGAALIAKDKYLSS